MSLLQTGQPTARKGSTLPTVVLCSTRCTPWRTGSRDSRQAADPARSVRRAPTAASPLSSPYRHLLRIRFRPKKTAVAELTASPRLPPLAKCQDCNDEPGDRIHPPPIEERVGREPEQ